MMTDDSIYSLRLAQDAADLHAAQRLRYRVFVEEMGATGPMVDHAAGLERDAFDPFFDHLILVDRRIAVETGDYVVGAYRLLPCDKLPAGGRFYSEDEYDLAPLRASGRRLLELGRTCVHPDHRGGAAMLLLWNALAEYVLEREIEVMFGPASFPGTDLAALAPQLSWLYHHHLAPEALRVRAINAGRAEMNLVPAEALTRGAVMAGIPALIKAYLRFGGFVGEGAFVDHLFNTTDVCLLMDTTAMSARHREYYTRKKGAS